MWLNQKPMLSVRKLINTVTLAPISFLIIVNLLILIYHVIKYHTEWWYFKTRSLSKFQFLFRYYSPLILYQAQFLTFKIIKYKFIQKIPSYAHVSTLCWWPCSYSWIATRTGDQISSRSSESVAMRIRIGWAQFTESLLLMAPNGLSFRVNTVCILCVCNWNWKKLSNSALLDV